MFIESIICVRGVGEEVNNLNSKKEMSCNGNANNV